MENNSENITIKIEYDDTITSTHPFPNSFWIQLTSNKTGYNNKLEFEKSRDPLANQPVSMWISDPQTESGFTLHEDTEWDKVR